MFLLFSDIPVTEMPCGVLKELLDAWADVTHTVFDEVWWHTPSLSIHFFFLYFSPFFNISSTSLHSLLSSPLTLLLSCFYCLLLNLSSSSIPLLAFLTSSLSLQPLGSPCFPAPTSLEMKLGGKSNPLLMCRWLPSNFKISTSIKKIGWKKMLSHCVT